MLAGVTRTLGAFAALSLLIASCGGTDSSTTTETWSGPQAPYPRTGALDVSAFQAYAESVDEQWERTPEDVALEYVQGERFDAQVVSSSWAPVVEGEVNALVQVQGLADDSVRDLRFVMRLHFEAQEGVWTVQSARWSQRCRVGRGHQTFSTEHCV
jgi:hypothetical protein